MIFQEAARVRLKQAEGLLREAWQRHSQPDWEMLTLMELALEEAKGLLDEENSKTE